MPVYVLGGEKGGTGKSALSQNMAVCLQLRGRDVLLVDADPQRTSAKWARRRAKIAGLRPIQHVELSGDVYTPLTDLRRRYQDIVIDVAGADSEELRTALLAADKLYTPMVPSESDLETAEDVAEVVKLIRASGNKSLRCAVVLNLCSNQSASDEIPEAFELLAPFAEWLPIAESHIHVRKPIRRAHKARLGVVEYASHPDRYVRAAASKAMWEVWRFYAEMTGDRAASVDTIGGSGTNGSNEPSDTIDASGSAGAG